MGSSKSKSRKKRVEVNPQLKEAFRNLSQGKSVIQRIDLHNAWLQVIDKSLLEIMEKVLFGDCDTIDYASYCDFFLQFYKGNREEKEKFLLALVEVDQDPGHSANGGLNIVKLEKTIESIISSFIELVQLSALPAYESWKSRACPLTPLNIKKYAKYIVTIESPHQVVSVKAITPEIELFLYKILTSLYNYSYGSTYDILPFWKKTSFERSSSCTDISLLDYVWIIFINMSLPVNCQEDWKLYFSTKLHGEGFSNLCSRIVNRGPCIIIVQDLDGYIFGGFASVPFKFGSNFVGTLHSFLFTLSPHIKKFSASAQDNHFQYLNSGQHTIPNGLGMGGGLDNFGLWLDAEFGNGKCSATCSTFKNYKILSGRSKFRIAHLEVWGVSPRGHSVEDFGAFSVLDKYHETRTILEMMGKRFYSDNCRPSLSDQ